MNITYAIALSKFPAFGPVSLRNLSRNFPDLEQAFHAGVHELIAAGIDEKTAEGFVAARADINPERARAENDAQGVSVISIDDAAYPRLLKEIPNPPLVLFSKGKLPGPEETFVAIVGTRLPTPYGRTMAYEFAHGLAQCGVGIASGLASGVDTIAHTATLEVAGRTIAVLGCGLDTIYPPANRDLAAQIIGKGGALLSEFPVGTPPLKHHFPMRNRIIAGLARATLVVEGRATSGSLITAREALEQNRDVFAIPGEVGKPMAEGPNMLLKAGAAVAITPDDILMSLELRNALPLGPSRPMTNDPVQEKILGCLDKIPRSIDDVVQRSPLPAADVLAAITTLEMRKDVRDVGGGMYIRV